MHSKSLISFAVVWAACFLLSAGEADRWPQFRGPDRTGLAGPGQEELPEEWSGTKNVLWSSEVPGRGWSSPIVWEDRVFVTSAISQGDFKEPWTGIYGNDYIAELRAQGLSMEEVMRRVRQRDNELPGESKEVRWMVYCLDAGNGEMRWRREAHQGLPHGGRHRKNTYASETPATDGERVYAYFGNVGLFAYTLEGEPVWTRRWEPLDIYLDFGTSSSPALHDGRLYILHDGQNGGWLAAVDAESGDQVWRVERRFPDAMIRSSFSSPFVWENEVRTEIVTLGPQELISYDLRGNELWRMGGHSTVAAPTPIAAGGMLFVGSGAPNENVRPLYAIKPGASGDISLGEDERSNQHVAWRQPRGGSYITSPLAYRSRVYVLYDKGFFGVFDLKTGEEIYKARFERGGHTFSASPWAYRGKVFCLSEQGVAFVIDAAADKFRVLGKNDLGEMTLATPAIAHDSLFIRTKSRLYRIGR